MNIREAVRRIGMLADVTPLRVSSLYRSERLGDAATTDFHNAAMTVLSGITPDALLLSLQAIEQALGRTRTVRWGDRTIDIDIILFGAIRMDTPRLTIPHPGFRTRPFVLLPSIEIDPAFRDIDGTPFTLLAQNAAGRCERLEGTSPPIF